MACRRLSGKPEVIMIVRPSVPEADMHMFELLRTLESDGWACTLLAPKAKTPEPYVADASVAK
eukprot:11413364-Alexandrium_andersonii.AAC.1